VRRDLGPNQPARYVYGLLLGQGLAWLVLAAAGLIAWITSFPGAGSLGDGAVFWVGVELLAIAVAGGVGAAEVGMACQMRGGPRLVVAMTGRLQGTMLAVALILAALLIMIGGSLLELTALSGLAPMAQDDGRRQSPVAGSSRSPRAR
jgi:hypothetical protein